MKFEDVRTYVKGVLTGSFLNKSTLDKLSTSEDGTLLFDGNEIKGGGGSSSVVDELYYGIDRYSEDEIVIGKFIDGRPIYRKVIPCNVKIGSSNQWYPTNIDVSDLNIDSIVNGYYKQYDSPAIPFLIKITANGIIQHWGTSSQLDHTYHYLIIEYVKTIDEPDSFKPSMVTDSIAITGISYDDYSEDEIVIGRFIDGKPLYRKCFVYNEIHNSGIWYDKPHNIENIEEIVKIDMTVHNVYLDVYVGTVTIANDTTLYINANTQKINLFLSRGNNQWDKIKCCLLYTKTTDAPDSFRPEMVTSMAVVDEATDSDVADVVYVLE